jgi:hypothetical protein
MRLITYVLTAVHLPCADAFADERISQIEFFGYKGIDAAAIRRALPVREGDLRTDAVEQRIRNAVVASIGKEPTDVAVLCCDESGDGLLFIGLPGDSSKRYAYHPEPRGKARLPASIMNLYARVDKAGEAAARKGGDATEEDDSHGYALIKDPSARSLQMAVRRWAVKHDNQIFLVLSDSSDVSHRRVAADALGYSHQSPRQIQELARASRDPDAEVRNNATRALGVLVRAFPAIAGHVPLEPFIEMLNSGRWSDRNKSAALLVSLTAGRDPATLTLLRTGALDSLVEMASWRRASHAYFARMLLGRVAGLPEQQVNDLAWNGPATAIIEAAVR